MHVGTYRLTYVPILYQCIYKQVPIELVTLPTYLGILLVLCKMLRNVKYEIGPSGWVGGQVWHLTLLILDTYNVTCDDVISWCDSDSDYRIFLYLYIYIHTAGTSTSILQRPPALNYLIILLYSHRVAQKVYRSNETM